MTSSGSFRMLRRFYGSGPSALPETARRPRRFVQVDVDSGPNPPTAFAFPPRTPGTDLSTVIRAFPILAVTAVTVMMPGAAAQNVRVQAPVVIGTVAPDRTEEDDFGVAVELFENPNLDRYLRKAQAFLAAERYADAIKVLQDVVEGRTVEVVEVQADPTPAEAPVAAETPPPPGSARGVDPSQSVFSPDGRLYRPVRRLCHELLAGMPDAGLQLYRASHEVTAERLLEQAKADGEVAALEQVANHYFVTLAAGRALHLAADRLIHQGRYRAAVQVLHDLLEVYPAAHRQALGIADVWLQFKIALAMRMAGERDSAREHAEFIARTFPRETLRIQGELQAMKDLPQSPRFAAEAVLPVAPRPNASHAWLRDTASLVPIWQFRYQEAAPYRPVQSRNQNEWVVFREGTVRNLSPAAHKFGRASWVGLFGGDGAPGSVLFFDNFRLRRSEAFSGLLTHEDDGRLDMPRPRENQPRPRVPAYDFGMLRAVEDDQRFYKVVGYEGTSTSTASVLRSTELVALDKATLRAVWSSKNWLEGEDGLAEVTFLAAPTLFGERLLLPVLRRDAYSLQCLDRHTGRPLWCTRLHAGGTIFFRAPGVPVRVQGGVAYLLTNAGVLAAVDAFSGDLRWLRRYERRHPLRPHRRGPSTGAGRQTAYGVQFQEADLPSFLPSDMVLAEGLVIFAPCDGDVLICVDGASGEPVWMIDGKNSHAPYRELQCIVGANSRHLYVAAEQSIVCIGLRSGVRLWQSPLPQAADDSLTRWRGRGQVTEEFVLMPGSREVLVLPAEGGQWRRLALPSFAAGSEPLRGPNNVFLSGPWLAIGYEAGLEVYSAPSALIALADDEADALRSASYLALAGRTEAAVQLLDRWLSGERSASERREGATRMLNLVRTLAAQSAAAGAVGAALDWIDRVRPHAADRQVRLNWHLARLDLFQQEQDLRAYEQEQQSLYRYMEGRDR